MRSGAARVAHAAGRRWRATRTCPALVPTLRPSPQWGRRPPSQLTPTNPIGYHLDARIWVAEWLQTGFRGVSRRARGTRFPCKSAVDRRGVEPLTSAVAPRRRPVNAPTPRSAGQRRSQPRARVEARLTYGGGAPAAGPRSSDTGRQGETQRLFRVSAAFLPPADAGSMSTAFWNSAFACASSDAALACCPFCCAACEAVWR